MLNAYWAGSFSALANSSKELPFPIYMFKENVEELDN